MAMESIQQGHATDNVKDVEWRTISEEGLDSPQP